MSAWVTTEKRKGGMNMQSPTKSRSQNLIFFSITFPDDCRSNQLLRLMLFKTQARSCTHACRSLLFWSGDSPDFNVYRHERQLLSAVPAFAVAIQNNIVGRSYLFPFVKRCMHTLITYHPLRGLFSQ